MGFFYNQFFVTPEYPTTSFAGQTIIVTGANVGLGFEAAQHFARLNAANVILAVRNIEAGNQAKKQIEESTNRPGCCQVWQLDLASFDSVKAFAERVSTLPRLDAIVENAGIATEVFSLAEGHERTVTVNVIGTFLLALLVLPKLKATAKDIPSSTPHLTIVSSEVHGWTEFPEWKAENTFAALSDENTTTMKERYPTSKLLEVLVVREIAPKFADSGVIFNMLNPGFCVSSLMRELEGSWLYKKVATFAFRRLQRTTEVGSRTLVLAAAAGPETHGGYMTNGKEGNAALSSFVTSDDGLKAQKKVWGELSEILEKIQPGVTSL